MSANAGRPAWEAPVVEVTLMEDRARVTRRGRARLPAGNSSLVLADVAPVLGDKTLSAKVLNGPPGARVNDVRARRERVCHPEEGPAETSALEQELRELSDELDARGRETNLLRGHATLLQGQRDRTLQDLAEDVAWGRARTSEWTALLDDLAARQAQARQQVLELERRVAELGERQADLRARLSALRSPRTAEKAGIHLDLAAAQAGEYEVQVEYIVPGACWRPYHTARLIPAHGKTPALVEFLSEGCVWQNTGEDWRGVRLSFSTQRPSLGTQPPLLRGDQLRSEPKPEVLVVGQREQEIQTAGLGAGEDAPRKKDAEGLPGIDDGGDAQLLSALAPADVPSDGRPYRVPVFRFESEAEAEQVCFPEKALVVFLRSEQTNRAERPILAGPVDLIREHGLVGRTSVLFIAPGEKFHLSWGPEHALRVWRESHEKEPEDTLLNAIKTWATLERRVELRLSNLGGQPCRVKVQERMPVSEIAQVVIEPDAERTTQGARPDANGFVSWDADLPPHGRKELTLRYRLKKRKDVVGV